MLSIPSEETSSGWSMLLGTKMLLVLIPGVGALVHQNVGDNVAKRGAGAGVSLLCGLTALLFGVMLQRRRLDVGLIEDHTVNSPRPAPAHSRTCAISSLNSMTGRLSTKSSACRSCCRTCSE